LQGYLTDGRILARSSQYNSGPGVTHSPGLLQLDTQPSCISENPGNDGPPGGGPVCLTSSLLQLESRPRSHGNRCINAGLVSTTRVCQSTVVLDSPLSIQGENAISTGSVNHSLLEDWFPILLELLEDYPLILLTLSDLVVMPTQQEFLMKQGMPQLIPWPISGNPIHHEDFLRKLQASFSPPGETKTTLSMDPPLLNGLADLTSRVEITFRDLYQTL